MIVFLTGICIGLLVGASIVFVWIVSKFINLD